MATAGVPADRPAGVAKAAPATIVKPTYGLTCVLLYTTYTDNAESRQANRKAQELTQKFEEAGLTVPAKQEVFVRTLGTDGGNVCDNPATARGKATLLSQLTNGASGTSSTTSRPTTC
jgi:hypothetical protein